MRYDYSLCMGGCNLCNRGMREVGGDGGGRGKVVLKRGKGMNR